MSNVDIQREFQWELLERQKFGTKRTAQNLERRDCEQLGVGKRMSVKEGKGNNDILSLNE